MVSKRDIFSISGPVHLNSINWKCPHHRRSIAACLVQGVYVSERDRQENREGSEAIAPPWWDHFHFEPIRKLVDDADDSIFGIIYEFNPLASIDKSNAPKYVIAFRGTITKKDSVGRDLALDLHFLQNGLHQTSRSELAVQAVDTVVSVSGDANVWLAGHSLGSAMATLAGKKMAKMGVLMETFLFNPPFVSAPIERIHDQKMKHGIRIATSLITAGLAFALKENPRVDSFSTLRLWVPNLFVNPSDHICSEYIGYFEHRRHMEEIGAGRIERLATQNSIGDLLLGAFGKESDPLHLLPSANLTTNLSPSIDFKTAHGLHQWWKPDLHLQKKQYIFS